MVLCQVEVIENGPGLVDQVFCANCAVVWGGKALISNMYNEPRRGETDLYTKWFTDKGFEVCNDLGLNLFLESIVGLNLINKRL